MALRNRLMTTLLTLATAATALPASACPPGGQGGYCPPSVPYYPAQRAVYPSQRVVHPAQSRATAQAATSQARAVASRARAVADQATAAARVRAAAAQAKAAFLARNDGTALTLMDQIVKAAPKNNEALQFRSLVRFATAEYKPAAADAYEAMKYGPIWNRKSLEGLYGDMQTYERHLKELQATADEQPEALDVHFLLAYEMLMSGDLAAGEAELETVLKIKPAEPLATNLLKVVRDVRRKETAVATDTP
jgi:hypothetical protein